jgi:hypothetical protein
MPVPAMKRKERVPVHAGEVYRCKARKGYRYVRIMQVRGLSGHNPYVIYREILPSGKFASGLDRHGIHRGQPHWKPLSWDKDHWYMWGFELVENWQPRTKQTADDDAADEGEDVGSENDSSR